MLSRRIGVQLASLRQPIKKALHIAAQLGAKAVEIDARAELRPEEMSRTAIRQFRKMLADLDLAVSAVSFPTRRGYAVADQLDRRIAATKRAMTFAHDLGAQVLVSEIGPVPQDETDGQWQTLIEALSDLGIYGNRAGALLAATTGAASGADLARLIDALPEGAIGVDLDPGNLIAHSFSATEAAAELGPNILHVAVTDAARDLAAGRGLHVQVGRGAVDYATLLATLEEQGYRGWFTIRRREAADPVAEIADTVQFLASF